MFDFNIDQGAILQELGLENSSPEVKSQVVEGIYESLSTRMRVRVGGLMSAEDYVAFDDVSKKGDAEAKAWLQNRFPGYQKIYEDELAQLVAELKRHADVMVSRDVINLYHAWRSGVVQFLYGYSSYYWCADGSWCRESRCTAWPGCVPQA